MKNVKPIEDINVACVLCPLNNPCIASNRFEAVIQLLPDINFVFTAGIEVKMNVHLIQTTVKIDEVLELYE